MKRHKEENFEKDQRMSNFSLVISLLFVTMVMVLLFIKIIFF